LTFAEYYFSASNFFRFPVKYVGLKNYLTDIFEKEIILKFNLQLLTRMIIKKNPDYTTKNLTKMTMLFNFSRQLSENKKLNLCL